MDFLKRTLLHESLHRFAGTLDKKDLAFVNEVVRDPRFERLMGHVQSGEFVREEISAVLTEKMQAKE